jgi:hypothetical protein
VAYALVGSAAIGNGASTFTTGAIDTTGADLLVMVVGYFTTPTSVSDSKGNSWTALTENTGAGNPRVRIYYAWNAIVGTGHTFTVTQAGSLIGSAVVRAYSGSLTSGDPFDQESSGDAASGNVTLGSLTPSADDCLIVTGLSNDAMASATTSINGGFTIEGFQDHVGGTSFGAGFADLIQTSAAAAAPTWTNSASACVAVMAVFKPSVGGGGGSDTGGLVTGKLVNRGLLQGRLVA